MSAEQAELSFMQPQSDCAEVVELELFLAEKNQWLTAHQLGVCLRANDRAIRERASQSDFVISFPGSPGYKHIKHCTSEEYHRYRAARLNQAREMESKVLRTDRIYYQRRPV